MTITELAELTNDAFVNDQVLSWIDPRQVEEVDAEKARRLNWAIYVEGKQYKEDPDDEVIVEYMKAYLNQRRSDVSATQLVDVAIYLMTTFWSGASSVALSAEQPAFSGNEANECANLLKAAFRRSSSWITKALLRNFTAEFFRPIRSNEVWLLPLELNKENTEFVTRMIQDREHVFSNSPR